MIFEYLILSVFTKSVILLVCIALLALFITVGIIAFGAKKNFKSNYAYSYKSWWTINELKLNELHLNLLYCGWLIVLTTAFTLFEIFYRKKTFPYIVFFATLAFVAAMQITVVVRKVIAAYFNTPAFPTYANKIELAVHFFLYFIMSAFATTISILFILKQF